MVIDDQVEPCSEQRRSMKILLDTLQTRCEASSKQVKTRFLHPRTKCEQMLQSLMFITPTMDWKETWGHTLDVLDFRRTRCRRRSSAVHGGLYRRRTHAAYAFEDLSKFFNDVLRQLGFLFAIETQERCCFKSLGTWAGNPVSKSTWIGTLAANEVYGCTPLIPGMWTAGFCLQTWIWKQRIVFQILFGYHFGQQR